MHTIRDARRPEARGHDARNTGETYGLSREQRVRARIDAIGDGADRWLAVRMEPRPPLDHVVQCVWFVAGDCAVRARLPPIAGMEFVVNLGDACGVCGPGVPAATLTSAWLEGLRDQWVETQVLGRTTLMGARLRAPDAFTLLGPTSGELGNRFTDAAEVLGGEVATLRERLGSARTLGQRFDVFEQFLRRRWRRRFEADRRSEWACHRLIAGTDAPGIRTLGRHAGLGQTRFSELMRAHTGLTPKRVARIARFDRVLRTVAAKNDVDWPSVALDHGFFDQSHLAREFHSMAGCTPVQFLRHRDALTHSVSVWT